MFYWDGPSGREVSGTSTTERFPCFRGQADQYTEIVLESEFGEIGRGWSDYGQWNVCANREMPIGEYPVWAYSFDPDDSQRISDDSDYLYIEISVEKEPHGSIMYRTIHNKVDYINGKYYLKKYLNNYDKSLEIFRYLSFPTLNYNKKDMLNIATKNGYRDILQLTWSCWYPINGKPCKRCIMCRERII